MMSREQRLITKKHIATHTNLILCLTRSILRYFSDKNFKSNIKLYLAGILTVTLQANLSLKASGQARHAHL